jgi:hypothetical protein
MIFAIFNQTNHTYPSVMKKDNILLLTLKKNKGVILLYLALLIALFAIALSGAGNGGPCNPGWGLGVFLLVFLLILFNIGYWLLKKNKDGTSSYSILIHLIALVLWFLSGGVNR